MTHRPVQNPPGGGGLNGDVRGRDCTARPLTSSCANAEEKKNIYTKMFTNIPKRFTTKILCRDPRRWTAVESFSIPATCDTLQLLSYISAEPGDLGSIRPRDTERSRWAHFRLHGVFFITFPIFFFTSNYNSVYNFVTYKINK